MLDIAGGIFIAAFALGFAYIGSNMWKAPGSSNFQKTIGQCLILASTFFMLWTVLWRR
jgi:hypothetical protein